MKLMTYIDNGRTGVGVLNSQHSFIDLTELGLAESMNALIQNFENISGRITEAMRSGKGERPLADAKLTAPIPTPQRNIFCVGKNYTEHAKEFGRSGFDGGAIGGEEIPEYPIIFSKPPSCVIGPDDEILSSLDPYDSVDYEGELAAIVGKTGRVALDDDPLSYVFGYTIFNDVTSRELQKRHKQWLLGKGIDTFGPMGPVIVTADEFHAVPDVHLSTWVNGERRQHAPISNLIFDVPYLIRAIGRSTTLHSGDVIATGTPAGVGIGFSPPEYLRKGDTVTVEITGIGILRNTIA